MGTIYEHTTNWLEPYKKKSVGARLNAVNPILDVSLQITERTATASSIPPPLDTCAPELDCLIHKQNAPLAHDSLAQDASWSIHKIE